jgi:hypothetical protein
MRTLELADAGTEGSVLVVAASSPLGAAGATGSCALDDSAKSVKPNRAVVLIEELVFTSASFSIPAGDFSCVLTLWKEGDFPARLPARQGNATDVSTFTVLSARSLFTTPNCAFWFNEVRA